jgi:hypothetical protein
LYLNSIKYTSVARLTVDNAHGSHSHLSIPVIAEA